MDAEIQTLRHSEATQWPWNPPRRRTRPTVDAEIQTLRHSEGYAVPRGILNPRLGREPSVADRVRKGGARERAKLLPQGRSGAERTLRRRRGRATHYMNSAQKCRQKKAKQITASPLCWHRPIFPARYHASIVSTDELNCRVRNGNGWTLIVINTNYL